jgi:hypothetical protein
MKKTALCQPYNNSHAKCSGNLYPEGKCECSCHVKTTATETNQYDGFRTLDVVEAVDQIGRVNVLAISGGRITRLYNSERETVGFRLPVAHGYRVDVLLAGNDTYTVRRVFMRAGKEFVKGEVENVYCDEVGEVAYVASCYVNRSFGSDLKEGDR